MKRLHALLAAGLILIAFVSFATLSVICPTYPGGDRRNLFEDCARFFKKPPPQDLTPDLHAIGLWSQGWTPPIPDDALGVLVRTGTYSKWQADEWNFIFTAARKSDGSPVISEGRVQTGPGTSLPTSFPANEELAISFNASFIFHTIESFNRALADSNVSYRINASEVKLRSTVLYAQYNKTLGISRYASIQYDFDLNNPTPLNLSEIRTQSWGGPVPFIV